MKILIIQTAFIGDVILATPIIEKLNRYFSGCTIDFLLSKGNESLLFNHPYIRKLLIFDKKTDKYRNLINLIRSIRAESYDFIINVIYFFTTGPITSLSGAKVKIGFDKNPLSPFFTHSVEHRIGNDRPVIHEVDRNLSLIGFLTDEKNVKPRLYPSARDYEKVEPFSKGEYICMAPASVWFTKQFPASKWVELIDRLPDKCTIYLMGGEKDLELCKQIKEGSASGQVEILAGQLTLLQSAALMEKASMTYTNDSAPAHLASAVNAPVTVIYCSTVPEFGFGPLSDVSYTVEVQESPDCRPCGLHGRASCPKGHFKCSDIDVGAIIERVNAG